MEAGISGPPREKEVGGKEEGHPCSPTDRVLFFPQRKNAPAGVVNMFVIEREGFGERQKRVFGVSPEGAAPN